MPSNCGSVAHTACGGAEGASHGVSAAAMPSARGGRGARAIAGLTKLSAKRKKREMQQDDDPSYKSLTAAYYDNIYYCGDFDELSSPEFPFEAKKPVPMAHANAAWRKTLKAKDDM